MAEGKRGGERQGAGRKGGEWRKISNSIIKENREGKNDAFDDTSIFIC